MTINKTPHKITWHKRILLLVIGIALLYGFWFDYLDSLRYPISATKFLTIGEMLGGNMIYQPWNIIGHLIPTLFLMFYNRKKLELALVGFLISTVVMDTPLWGIDVLYLHPSQHLWKENNLPTDNLWEWIAFYYNPIGTYGVWGSDWYPPAWLMFWSLPGRIALAGILILIQHKMEKKRGKLITFRELFKKDSSMDRI